MRHANATEPMRILALGAHRSGMRRDVDQVRGEWASHFSDGDDARGSRRQDVRAQARANTLSRTSSSRRGILGGAIRTRKFPSDAI